MAVTELLKGSQPLDGTEQDLFASQTSLINYQTDIFFSALVGADEVIVRVYQNDPQLSVETEYRTIAIRGVQDSPCSLANYIPTDSYRVTVEQTVGSFKTITWVLYGV